MKYMRLDLCQKLYDVAPTLFGRETFYITEKIAPGITQYNWFNIECGDGWFEILLSLCKRINAHIKSLPDDIAKDITVLQIKEKNGCLRFYVSHYDKVIDDLIKQSEETSSHVCETCGKPGKLRGSVWLYTSCEDHSRPEDSENSVKDACS